MIRALPERLRDPLADTGFRFIVTYAITLLSDVSRRIPELPYGLQVRAPGTAQSTEKGTIGLAELTRQLAKSYPHG